MVLISGAAIATFLSGVTLMGIVYALLAGFTIGLLYKVVDVADDYVESYVLDAESERAVYDATHDAVDNEADEEGWDADTRAQAHRDADNLIKPDFLDDIANKLGISVDTLKYLIIGIIGFLILKG